MKRAQIHIPQTELEELLATTVQVKREMQKLLLELEAGVTKNDIQTPGKWRHDPVSWAKKHNLLD